MKVILYTDGSSRGNPGPGGYGAVLQFVDSTGKLHERELSQGYATTTNNRMELLGVIVALEALKAAGSTDPAKVMEALPGVTYDGVSGHIAFDDTGDAIRDTAYIKTIDAAAGAWTFVTQQKAS